MKLLPARDSAEFSAGMVLGMALGAGVALLVAPGRTERDLEKTGRLTEGQILRRGVRRVPRARKEDVSAGSRFQAALSDLGREFVRAARDELTASVRNRLQGAVLDNGGRSSLSALRSAPERLRALRRSLAPGSDA